MTLEHAGKVATGVVEGLRSQPLALALVCINVLYLVAGGFFMWSVFGLSREHSARRDALMAQLAKDCIVITAPQPKSD